jgi:hypothetical protein
VKAGILSFIVVLLCVPALTRVGQKLQPVTPISQAPSFAKNIDCPPKKITVTPAVAIVAVVLVVEELEPVATFVPPPAPRVPDLLVLGAPAPLRAPPSARSL